MNFEEILKEANSKKTETKVFQVIIKDLESGKELTNEKTNAVIGCFAKSEEEAQCFVVTNCNTKTLIGVVDGAENAVRQAKKSVEDNMAKLLVDMFLGGRR